MSIWPYLRRMHRAHFSLDIGSYKGLNSTEDGLSKVPIWSRISVGKVFSNPSVSLTQISPSQSELVWFGFGPTEARSIRIFGQVLEWLGSNDIPRYLAGCSFACLTFWRSHKDERDKLSKKARRIFIYYSRAGRTIRAMIFWNQGIPGQVLYLLHRNIQLDKRSR